jgi:hypothetical protein
MNNEKHQGGFDNAIADCFITWTNLLEAKENEHGKGKENPKNPRR